MADHARSLRSPSLTLRVVIMEHLRQASVPPAIVRERLAVGDARREYFADEDRVISGFVDVHHPAFERGQRMIQQRQSVRPELVADAGEAVVDARSKSPRDRLLIFGQ